MTNTPAVGVCAGRIGGRVASPVFGWTHALRSALLASATLVAVVACLAVWLAIGARPVSADSPNSLGLRATYDVDAQIRWQRGDIIVSSTAHVRNTSSHDIRGLTFNLLPLRLGHADVGEVTIRGTRVDATVSGQSLIVPFSGPLAPGKNVHVTITYRAIFNTNTAGKKALFMKKGGIIAAYRWIPWLSREQQFSTPNFGESWVTGNSPSVTVRLTADRGLTYATSGRRTSVNGNTQVFTATNVRDFNFSASPDYRVKKQTWNGITVRVYFKEESPNRLMDWSMRALKRFSNMVGRYPYSHLNVAETPAGVGMESPAMTWVDSSLSNSRFPYVVVHEMAHQWFYGAVGNNQATQPFLDEAVADFLTRDLLGSFRKSQCSTQRLDKSVYDYRGNCYPEVIYVQGGIYLRDHRARIGAEAFWSGLREFYRDHKFEIAGTRSLLDYLDSGTGFNSQRHEKRFPSLY